MLRRKLNLREIEEENDGNCSKSIPLKMPKLDIISQSSECLDLSLDNCKQGEKSKYFLNASVDSEAISQRMISLQRCLNEMLEITSFLKHPICYVYNPTIYAVEPSEKYFNLYCNTPKKLIFLGMNPGPWGMCQTGVPFGEVVSVRDWLQIEGKVTQPESVCSERKIEGFNCKRKEISGDRFWNFFRKLCGSPEVFFKNSIVYNYCPIALMKKDGGNLTPADIEISLRSSLEEACDKNLIEIIKLLKPECIIGVGRYTENRAKIALKSLGADIKVIYMPHPSPRVVNNQNWPDKADKVIKENDLLKYFQ